MIGYRLVCVLTLLLVAQIAPGAAADIRAITQDGRTVVLAGDGTWRYASEAQRSAKSGSQETGDEKAHWVSIATSQNVADYRTFLEKYPGGTFASIARLRLKDLSIGKQVPGREAKPAVNVDDITAFNGDWKFDLSLSGDCDGVIVRRLTVNNGKIQGEVMHPSVGLYQVTGKIDRHGNFKGYASGSVGSGRFEGRMSSENGSGELRIDAGELTCTGNWTAKRKV